MSLQTVLDVLESQLGKTEYPPNSNNVIYNTDYYGHEVSGSAYPWCVTFLWDVFKSAGESQAFYGGNKTASCTDLKNYYSGLRQWSTTDEPEIGDILIFNFSGGSSPMHAGLFVGKYFDSKDNIWYYQSIDGNTSLGTNNQDNGGIVAKKSRTRASIVGICHIQYSNSSTMGGAIGEQESQQITYNSSPSYQYNSSSKYNGTRIITEDVTIQETRDVIQKVNGRDINEVDYGPNLLSYPSLVEAPYITVEIGGYTFGKYNETRQQGSVYINYPNFVTSLDIVKINGQLNVYTIKMVYQIRFGDDPNFVDKILSSVGYGKIKISYGDYASPSFQYKQEEALITKVTSNVDFSTSRINYTISCTSSALKLLAKNNPYGPYWHRKPSEIIRNELLAQGAYNGLADVFPGITGKNLSNSYRFIASDDQAVDIPAVQYMDPVSMINYLVSYMIPESDPPASTQRSASYFMTIHDDSYADYSNVGGTYFKVTKVPTVYQSKAIPIYNTYTVDVGYPGGDNPGENLVLGFNVVDDNSWALLYNYAEAGNNIAQQNYTYEINDNGQMIQTYSPNGTINGIQGKTTAATRSWWTRMTEFPISATLTIKGLVRSAMLMTYLRVNSYFYGKKHVSSGLYIITKQEDKIDGSGYRTTLSLTRIAGADEYIERKSYLRTETIITGVQSDADSWENTVPVEEEVVTWTQPSIFQDTNKNSLYKVLAGCQKYVVYDQVNYKICTDVTQYPFVDGEVSIDDDNRQFVIWPIQNCVTYTNGMPVYYDPEYFEEDIWGYESQWVNYHGIWGGTVVEIQQGNQVYYHPPFISSVDSREAVDIGGGVDTPLEHYTK